jgi:hypothetical protein
LDGSSAAASKGRCKVARVAIFWEYGIGDLAHFRALVPGNFVVFALTWLLSASGPFGRAPTGQLADFMETGRKFALIGYEDGKPLLDGKANRAPRADELLLIAGQSGLAIGIEGAAQMSEEGIVHGFDVPQDL